GGKFDPDEWAQLFADAGARFAGPVAEHHDGFAMWASEVNPWNAKVMGPKLDLVGLLTDAIRKKNMKVILSMHHAYNISGFYEAVPKTSDPKLQILFGQFGKEKNEEIWLLKHMEIIDKYKPDIIWQDFNLHLISKPNLLGFLSYYYNKAQKWGKDVVATYKDGLNTKCAVLDYERGGPSDIMENYWLTDDAISSSSWCYTEGIGYYSTKQVLHGFLDRVSKNGNLLLNISPKADGTIPVEQKDILLAMGAWLKKYGESVYATRAWEKYGEGPTKMGSGHGVFTAPAEGTYKDARFTKSKDNSTLYAILLGWENNKKEIILRSLSQDRIDLRNLKSVEIINGEAGNYLPLYFNQDANGLIISLPEKSFEDLAYVIKLNFEGDIPPLDNYASLNSSAHYYLIPENNDGNLMLGSDLKLDDNRDDSVNQWKLDNIGKGYYKISNRENANIVLGCSNSSKDLTVSNSSSGDNQIWKIDDARNGNYIVSNKQFPNMMLSVNGTIAGDNNAELINSENTTSFKWKFIEVCEIQRSPYKPNTIPGIIEAEDYDIGCPDEAYHDSDEVNQGGNYRPTEGVDIDKCSEGGYNLGWINAGEWVTYTVNVSKDATYKITFHTATISDNAKMGLEFDGENKTGNISVPNTSGFQNWTEIEKTIELKAGEHILKVFFDSGPFNLDKMVFEKLN
ncbi:MAG: alpha-L-fucosidase, partial [Ignavibacteriae bacterium]|nr:alpha-L-fucosidase [Ignavibacteriota bacterium]